MTAKRVLLASPLFHRARGWMEVLAMLPGVVVVGWAANPIDTLLQAVAQQVECVVVDLPSDGSDPGLPSHLLQELPDTKVLAVSADNTEIVVYEREVVRKQLAPGTWSDPDKLGRALE